jgi:hypothetical protein
MATVAEREDSRILNSIRELKEQDPFAPFTIVMTSGDKYRIEAGQNLVEMKTEFFYAFPGGDKFVLIRMNQIAAVERGTDRRPTRRKAS